MLGVHTPALPASLRRTNQRTVISLLLRLGSASRADLAKAAGISQPTAGKITADLLDMGILRQAVSTVHGATEENPRLGRPGQMLELENRFPRFLGIEVGITETLVSALPVAVKLEDQWTHSFPTPASADIWERELRKVAADLRVPNAWGALVSVPGIVDEAAGKIIFSPNLHWLEQAEVPAIVSRVFDLPSLLVQEIRALALGHLTAEPNGQDFLLIDFGQGVGGAIVLDGKLFSHPMPISGEIGHSPVAGNQRKCGCGATGCLETLVSQRGLIESFGEAAGSKSPSWEALVQHVRQNGLEPWLRNSLEAAGKIIAGALNVLGIHKVILTGLVLELPPQATNFLVNEIESGAMWARFGQVTCSLAPHHRAAGLVAAGIDRLVLPEDEKAGVVSSPAGKPNNGQQTRTRTRSRTRARTTT